MLASSDWVQELETFSSQLLQAVKDHVDTEQVCCLLCCVHLGATLLLTAFRNDPDLLSSWATALGGLS
jgi:hypothetical protein